MRCLELSASEHGIAIVEAAIFIPLLLLLAFGIFDYSYYLRQGAAAADAVGKAARLAAAFSTQDPKCHTLPNDEKKIERRFCNNVATGPADKGTGKYPFTLSAKDGLDAHAKKAACGLMQDSNLDLDEWHVRASKGQGLVSGSVKDIIHVEVNRVEPACLICYKQVFAKMKSLNFSVDWILEGTCRN